MASKFIHCDCDCFFAAVEVRDDPSLRGLPVAVGGSAARRGVIATCNYEARQYGIHSAMASATAQRLCPDLLIIPNNMEKYRAVSLQVRAILRDFSSLIEPLSLDEAFLDITHSSQFHGSGTLIAKEIRRRVREELGITLSAGVAPNKFLAKVASDWNKPDGQFVIEPAMVGDFVARLPVEKLPGVGPVTAGRMAALGVKTCGDLQKFSRQELAQAFGGFGERLYDLCRGLDDRPIETDSQRKSISVEHTFPQDLPNLELCLSTLPELLAQLEARLRSSKKKVAISKQFVKIKFDNFVSTTVEHKASALDPELFRSLCRTGFERGKRPVRLLGLGVRMKQLPRLRQLEFRFEH